MISVPLLWSLKMDFSTMLADTRVNNGLLKSALVACLEYVNCLLCIVWAQVHLALVKERATLRSTAMYFYVGPQCFLTANTELSYFVILLYLLSIDIEDTSVEYSVKWVCKHGRDFNKWQVVAGALYHSTNRPVLLVTYKLSVLNRYWFYQGHCFHVGEIHCTANDKSHQL